MTKPKACLTSLIAWELGVDHVTDMNGFGRVNNAVISLIIHSNNYKATKVFSVRYTEQTKN